jgi:hypothetical protein
MLKLNEVVVVVKLGDNEVDFGVIESCKVVNVAFVVDYMDLIS